MWCTSDRKHDLGSVRLSSSDLKSFSPEGCNTFEPALHPLQSVHRWSLPPLQSPFLNSHRPAAIPLVSSVVTHGSVSSTKHRLEARVRVDASTRLNHSNPFLQQEMEKEKAMVSDVRVTIHRSVWVFE